MHTIDYLVIALYFLGLIGVILLIKRAKSVEDFAVGSRQIPSSIVFASLAANAIGPGYSMGLANKAAANGYIWFVIFLGFSLQTILIGYFVAPKLRKFSKAYTIGDIMGYKYGKLVKYIAGVLSILLCAGFVGAIANASGSIINTVFGIKFIWGVIITTIFVIAYTTYGGIKVDIFTDVLHFIIMAIAIPVILFFIKDDLGFEKVSEMNLGNMLDLPNDFTAFSTFALFISFFLGETLIPSYTNRALAAKSESHAKKGFIMAGVFTIVWFLVCSSVGFLGVEKFPNSNNVFLDTIKEYLPVGFYGLIIAVLVNIVMKSQDSLLNAASVSLNNDILGIYGKENKRPLLITRIFNIVIGTVAVLFAVSVPSVIDALLICYTLWAPTLVLPLIICVIKKDVKPISGFVAILAGGIGTAIWEWGLGNPDGIPSVLVGIVLNQAAFWTSELFSPNIKNKYFQPIKQ